VHEGYVVVIVTFACGQTVCEICTDDLLCSTMRTIRANHALDNLDCIDENYTSRHIPAGSLEDAQLSKRTQSS
jgi:hypothetical protein